MKKSRNSKYCSNRNSNKRMSFLKDVKTFLFYKILVLMFFQYMKSDTEKLQIVYNIRGLNDKINLFI
jgi:hypothetical protein